MLSANVPTDQETTLRSPNGDLTIRFPAGFVASPTGSVAVQVFGDGVGLAVEEIMIVTLGAGLAAGSGTVVRSITIAAALPNGQPIDGLVQPIDVCASFGWAEVQGVDQAGLQPYWVEPTTRQLSPSGLTRTGLEPATESRPGRNTT